ncbi:MAG: polymer-forming cytoskeletal protein [Sulfuricella sp.]|nr:polymer-forming cytoskeletal protein [Sulfuricella sp.]
MNIFKQKDEKAHLEAVPRREAGQAAEAVKSDSAHADEKAGSKMIVGPGIRLLGSEITDCDTVIVEGWVEATVDGRVMQISEKGTFTGVATVDEAEIRGLFKGDLTVRKRLTVCATGKVSGKIRYGKLVVEEGGELSGDVSALGAEQPLTIKLPGKPAGKPELPAKQGETWPPGQKSDTAVA